MTENQYQAKLIKKIEARLPDCVVVKNDPNYRQGILDLTIFNGPYWAALEVKASRSAAHQPNQDWYVDRFNDMSFAAFVYPENEEEVLLALEQALSPRRRARVPQPQ